MDRRSAPTLPDYAGRTVESRYFTVDRFFRNVFNCGTDFRSNAHRRHTGLAHYLEKRGIKDIYLMGLALDHCVKYSTLDARQLGFKTHLIVDGCRGIELEPGDIDRALDEMKRAGAVLLKAVICSRRR